MDTKSLAKSKRAHTLHHKKHHPNQKAKAAASSAGVSSTDKAPGGKTVKEKPRASQGKPALPSNWDRYEDEDDPMTENQVDGPSNQPSDVAVPKSKGADYAYLLSEAKSQNSTRSLEIFPSLDDFVSDFGQGKDTFFAVRGESLLSSVENDTFFVEDKTSTSYEASFLSLNLQALSEQLAKIDLPKRLFMEADLFLPEQYSERGKEYQNSSQDLDDVNRNEMQAYDHHEVTSSATTKSHYQTIQDHTSSATVNPMVHPTPDLYSQSVAKPRENQFKVDAETAENELDMLLNSFADTNLKEQASLSTPKETVAFDIDSTLDDLLNETSTHEVKKTVAFDIDSTLDDLLNETSTHEVKSTSLVTVPPNQPVSKSELLDDFDSWLDTI